MFGPDLLHVHGVEGILHSPKRVVGIANVALRSEHEGVRPWRPQQSASQVARVDQRRPRTNGKHGAARSL